MDEDKLRICPFNKYHVIRAGRFLRHVLQCKKNNPHIKVFFCDYKNIHVFKTHKELSEHLLTCPEKERFELAAERHPGFLRPVKKSTFVSIFQMEDDW